MPCFDAVSSMRGRYEMISYVVNVFQRLQENDMFSYALNERDMFSYVVNNFV